MTSSPFVEVLVRMRIQYCWRCRTDVPMLDEEEFAAWDAVFSRCIQLAKSARRDGTHITEMDSAFGEARLLYSHVTGAPDTDHNEIRHHRLWNFGPPCGSCGRPLRTPEARMCAECGELLAEKGP
jgi:hypothetical protein